LIFNRNINIDLLFYRLDLVAAVVETLAAPEASEAIREAFTMLSLFKKYSLLLFKIQPQRSLALPLLSFSLSVIPGSPSSLYAAPRRIDVHLDIYPLPPWIYFAAAAFIANCAA